MGPPSTTTYTKQAWGIRQDASMCGLCATATPQRYVQTQGFSMDLSGIRHLLSHGLQTMHSRPSHGPVACHVQFVCTANALQEAKRAAQI